MALAYRIGLVKGTDNNGGLSRFEPKKLAERQAVARLAYEFRPHRDSYISAAQTLLSSGESTGTGTTDGSKETAPAVTGVIVINSSTVEVTLSSAPKSVSKEQFSFSNGLTVTAASIKSGSPNVVVLTTSGMTAGTPYTLSYEGEPTELSIIGVAASTPGAPAGSTSTARQIHTGVLQELKHILNEWPMQPWGIHCDNGQEFLNNHLRRFCASHHLRFTRSRPYRKVLPTHTWSYINKDNPKFYAYPSICKANISFGRWCSHSPHTRLSRLIHWRDRR